MRTTIELTEEQRAELLKIAAQRGMKGFSQVVQEAIDAYLRGQGFRQKAIEAALEARGSLKDKEADALEERTSSIRARWR